MLYDYEDTRVVTVNDLNDHRKEMTRVNEYWKSMGDEKLIAKVYSMKEYADKRRITDIFRFDYRPICGEKIDWKGIAKRDDDQTDSK